MLKRARYSIDIFSHDLEAKIYDNLEVEQSIIDLAKKHSKARIRILAQNTTSAVQNGHCLIRLAQQLSSYVLVHKPSDDYKDERSAFVVVDNTGFIHRTSVNDSPYKAAACFNGAGRTTELLGFFNAAWEHSSPDMQCRRLYI